MKNKFWKNTRTSLSIALEGWFVLWCLIDLRASGGAAPCSVDKWCSASQRLWHPRHPTNNNVQSSLWATFSLKYQEQQILSVLSKITSLSMLQTIQLFLKIITWVLNIQFNQRYSLLHTFALHPRSSPFLPYSDNFCWYSWLFLTVVFQPHPDLTVGKIERLAFSDKGEKSRRSRVQVAHVKDPLVVPKSIRVGFGRHPGKIQN